MDQSVVNKLPTNILSEEQLQNYGSILAESHVLCNKKHKGKLLQKLSYNEKILNQALKLLIDAMRAGSHITPAGEWLLDNFYLIEEQISITRRHFPKDYEKNLPHLVHQSKSDFHPRIYDIALQIIGHGDGHLTLETLTRFINSYQNISFLTLDELWALPVMLRLALIENLGRIGSQLIENRIGRDLAEYWADLMIDGAQKDPQNLVLIIADMIKAKPFMNMAFVAELTRRLQNAELAFPINWIELKLAEENLTIEQLVQTENTTQAANQVTISNCIHSLRFLNELDWRAFVEAVSVVEKKLREDPANVYRLMNFETRDSYRHVVKKLERLSNITEMEVASTAIDMARQVKQINSISAMKQQHVGYYLIDEGLLSLKQKLNIKNTVIEKIVNHFSHNRFLYYFLTVFILTAIPVAYLVNLTFYNIAWFWTVLLTVIILIAMSEVILSIINPMLMFLKKPYLLPQMDFSKRIPDTARTLVVVPTLLKSINDINTLIEGLEIRFLGNKSDNIYYALLTDFADAPQKELPEDSTLIELAKQSIEVLNKRYSKNNKDIFFLLHRDRSWNEQEQKWMGHERKRGKLENINDLLVNLNQKYFSHIFGNISALHDIRYVITLDFDTQLPRETAHQLISTMAHPLNQPEFDVNDCVIKGHGILQPRVEEALSSASMTRYLSLFNNEYGIDPYTRAVSNLYQDLFNEGSFIGKGIYDVAAFQKALVNRFDDNQILSHDLLEGCYLRAGYTSNIVLYETSPRDYLSDVKRRYRWIRGDWQLLPWLLPKVPGRNKHYFKNPLSALSRWKLFDNLRRSVISVAWLALFIFAWLILPNTNFWYGFIIFILLLPAMLGIITEFTKIKTKLIRHYFNFILHDIKKRFLRFFFYITTLPYEAWYNSKAILITLWRLTISHQHLLEWIPFQHINRDEKKFSTWLTSMCVAPIFAIVITIVLLISDKWMTFCIASPLLIIWLLSPAIAYWFSQPIKFFESKLKKNQIKFLHIVSRKTWAFFETFVTAEDNWLPPDNFQIEPIRLLAHRTSPTNIGLALLANLSAYDFGYITLQQLLQRTEDTLQTMKKLERHRGHFYNWYDTISLQALAPRYISTVDNGNLIGHLLTLRQGLLNIRNDVIFDKRYLNGIKDTFSVLQILNKTFNSKAIKQFKSILRSAHDNWNAWPSIIKTCDELSQQAELIAQLEQHEWSQKLMKQCKSVCDQAHMLSQCSKQPVDTLIQLSNTETGAKLLAVISKLTGEIFSFAQMDFTFLYNETSRLMKIGYNVDKAIADNSVYDLLSSEARLANFIAIAQGQLPQESWFALGRLQILSKRGKPLVMSWSGSMFEYLMPLLVMPTYEGTLLDQMCKIAVETQIAYGKQNNVPWGFSESGYYAWDTNYNYFYSAFGVPELGLKRGLEDDLVVAPYASVMALMIAPEEACLNLQRLTQLGMLSDYGFYEAVDYTLRRLPANKTSMIISSYMAHHQGMSLLALSYLLHQQPMQKRFTADPLIQATVLLLQERLVKPTVQFYNVRTAPEMHQQISMHSESFRRVFTNPSSQTPHVQLLSNGRYHVMLTNAGSGYIRWNDIAVTRWRDDVTLDNKGFYSYICDVNTNEFWSTAFQPTTRKPEVFETIFSEAHVEFHRIDNGIDCYTEIAVSPEDDIELRRTRLRNDSKVKRILEFTSYAEVVLTRQQDDEVHPAFSNLFVETEILSEQNAILVKRRNQDDEHKTLMFHMINVQGNSQPTLSFETSRHNFIGRCGNLSTPAAMLQTGKLSNTQGAVLDPIVSIRYRFTLKPGEVVTLYALNGISDNREHCISLIEKYRDQYLQDRIFELSWTHSQVLLHQLNIREGEARSYQKFAASIIYGSNLYRPKSDVLANNWYGQSKLWGYAISGDLPIVVLRIEQALHIELVRQFVQAQTYWRRKGLIVDLFIINEADSSYRQVLQDQITNLVNTSHATEHKGSIFVRFADQMPMEDKILIQSVARIVLSDKNGSLKEQANRKQSEHKSIPKLVSQSKQDKFVSAQLPPLPNLHFYNGTGGFDVDNNEYIISLTDKNVTPAPWINVLANPDFGTFISESGSACTWNINSQEFRLTPWNNDATCDYGAENFYIRDDVSGKYWSPTLLPARGQNEYRIRHGFGYSIFEHIEKGIYSELNVFVSADKALKFSTLKIKNISSQQRQLSAYACVEWILGDLRSKNFMHISTETTAHNGILAQNHYNSDYQKRTGFFLAINKTNISHKSFTADRTEFIGRNNTNKNPLALEHEYLSGKVGEGLDPCAALHLAFKLAPGQSCEIIFILGAGANKEEANKLIDYCYNMNINNEWQAVKHYWQQTLGQLNIRTPDAAVNTITNGWLIYQVISSRLWGRTAFYQSSGAFGYRDQLQDVISLSHTQPTYFRQQILLCASRQFVEGDVQHWWHMPSGKGVRTRCSDDYLWLAYAVCRYLEMTGDYSILDEQVHFITGRPLKPEEENYYDLPTISTEIASIYEHCVRSIKHGLTFGSHGLPLIGSCDWNDGMDKVGIKGLGESVWLAFFLCTILLRFQSVARYHKDDMVAELCVLQLEKIKTAIELNAWDGEWYKRAYFDDGTPLGSSSNSECRIDSIAQSWAVISAVGKPDHAKQAMQSLHDYLVKIEDKLILLFTPPFNVSKPDPGYIQDYVPGIRENGGQYTHAAAWTIKAFAELKDYEFAWQLLSLINPVNHALDAKGVQKYKIEPYVLAGDVYSVAPHTGRGGWSWYSGSAGWVYQVIIESLLGIHLVDGKYLALDPHLPEKWNEINISYRYGSTQYEIQVMRSEDTILSLDGVILEDNLIPLVDDQKTHVVIKNV